MGSFYYVNVSQINFQAMAMADHELCMFGNVSARDWTDFDLSFFQVISRSGP